MIVGLTAVSGALAMRPPVPTVPDSSAAAQNRGACCRLDGSCSVTTQRTCERQGGIYRGNGTTCTPNPCSPPTGACCIYDDNGIPTCSRTTAATCARLDGLYMGDGTNCATTPCPVVLVLGACCIDQPNGNASCFETSEQDCALSGGTYVGDGTLCAGGDCIDATDPTGACCVHFPFGSCSDVSELECNLFGGVYQGNGTTCAETLCGIGL